MAMDENNNWPADADGDVLRRLRDRGFDFSRRYTIDFNIDFDAWPPSQTAIARLKEIHQNVTLFEPEGEPTGEVVVQITDLVSYDLVVRTQAAISNAMRPFGGRCDAWGVLHDGQNSN